MRTKKVTYLLIFFIVWVTLVILPPQLVNAQEDENGGGAVQTNGEIGFYEEDGSIESSTLTSSSKPIDKETSIKPKGRYPSTGELVKKSLSISGAVVVVIVLGYFLLRRKKEKQEGKGH